MPRWGILLARQMLFVTDDEEVARRFMALGHEFRVYDHSTGYYASTDHKQSDSRDLLSESEFPNTNERMR